MSEDIKHCPHSPHFFGPPKLEEVVPGMWSITCSSGLHHISVTGSTKEETIERWNNLPRVREMELDAVVDILHKFRCLTTFDLRDGTFQETVKEVDIILEHYGKDVPKQEPKDY